MKEDHKSAFVIGRHEISRPLIGHFRGCTHLRDAVSKVHSKFYMILHHDNKHYL